MLSCIIDESLVSLIADIDFAFFLRRYCDLAVFLSRVSSENGGIFNVVKNVYTQVQSILLSQSSYTLFNISLSHS